MRGCSNRNPEVTEAQWHQFKSLFRHEWWQWSEEKRREELAIWIIRANYLFREDGPKDLNRVNA